MALGPLYARRERTTDSATADMLKMFKSDPPARREAFYRRREHMDVQLYADAACTRPVARFPWHYSNKPTPRKRFVMVNCARYALEWVEENRAA